MLLWYVSYNKRKKSKAHLWWLKCGLRWILKNKCRVFTTEKAFFAFWVIVKVRITCFRSVRRHSYNGKNSLFMGYIYGGDLKFFFYFLVILWDVNLGLLYYVIKCFRCYFANNHPSNQIQSISSVSYEQLLTKRTGPRNLCFISFLILLTYLCILHIWF